VDDDVGPLGVVVEVVDELEVLPVEPVELVEEEDGGFPVLEGLFQSG